MAAPPTGRSGHQAFVREPKPGPRCTFSVTRLKHFWLLRPYLE
jgi:hypothetical protein